MKKWLQHFLTSMLFLGIIFSFHTISGASDDFLPLLPKFSPFPETGVITLNGYRYELSLVSDVMTDFTIFKEGSNKKIKSFEDVSSVFIGKEKLFFIENKLDSSEGKLYSTDIEGNNKVLIKKFKSSPTIRRIRGNYVDYITNGEKTDLYTLNWKTGKEKVVLKDQSIIEVTENKIFSYISKEYNSPGQIYSYDFDGTDRHLLDDQSRIIDFDNGRLYYVKFVKTPTYEKNGKLQILSVNSLAEDKKTHGKTFTANEIVFVSEGYAYFIKLMKDGNYRDYKLNLNTGKISKSEPLPYN